MHFLHNTFCAVVVAKNATTALWNPDQKNQHQKSFYKLIPFLFSGSSDFPVGKPPKPVSAPTPTLPRMKDKKTYVGGRDSVSTIMISEFLSPSPSHACPSVYGIRGRVGVGGDTQLSKIPKNCLILAKNCLKNQLMNEVKSVFRGTW